MWTLMIEGGYPMWFLLVVGAIGFISAVRYARRPSARGLWVVAGLAVTTLFGTCTGVAADLAAFGHKAPAYLKLHPEMSLSDVVLLGIGELMSPAVFGCSLLAITALVVTFGLRRAGAHG